MDTPCLSRRSGLWRPSPTLAMADKARRLKAQGCDVVSLSAGEPDFDSPDVAVEAAIQALHTGMTKYVGTAGIPVLRQAIAEKAKAANGLQVDPDQVVVSCGAKQSLFNAIMTLVDPGDEVVLFAPYWMTYADQAILAGGVPKVVQTRAENGFVPNPDEVLKAFGPKTKLVVCNSPSNPTGAVYPREFLSWLGSQVAERGIWLLSDEIYERLVYGVSHFSPASLSAEVAARTVTVSGCSKSYAMTGWRIGYALAPTRVAEAMRNLQDQTTSNATSFAQAGALAAIRDGDSAVEQMRQTFARRRETTLRLLREMPGVQVNEPKGAFYAFPDVSAHLGGPLRDDQALADHLLSEALVATVPGSVFGGPGHLRVSYAASDQDIEKGLGRIAQALNDLAS